MRYSLKELRARKSLTQAEVAEKVEVSEQTYYLWEKNPEKIQVGKLYRLAEIFGVTIDEIFVGFNTPFEDAL